MIANDGKNIVYAFFCVFALTVAAWYWFPSTLTAWIMGVFGALALFNLLFFRDPARNTPNMRLAVIAPGDGKIVQISNVTEPDYFNKEVRRISIFLSVFNVHVNRVPVSGRVDYFAYKTGKFLMAHKESASHENEQTAIGIINEFGHRVLFKQIAGLIARRIVCHLREGQMVAAGERMGMIRYGSRVDVFLPIDARLLVKTGQTVRGGETVLATFPDEGSLESEEQKIVEVPKSELST